MAETGKEATALLDSLNEVGELCTPETGSISVPTPELVETILKLAGAMAEIMLYDYQKDFARRMIESILLRDAAMITAEFSRQSGKTSTVACVVVALMVILPALAKQFPKDWRFNLTDEDGRYRGYRNGINIGIYAPIMEQAQTNFERMRMYVSTPTAMGVLADLGLKALVNRGDCLSLSNGSSVIAKSASKGSNIEGKTHHLLILEEAQDIDTMKVRKSIHPMIAATKGTMVKIGTASIRKCDFYLAINQNKRREAVTNRRDHFRYDYETCQKSNSLYRDYVIEEKSRLGEQSDEFRMAYKLEWILERGMFLTTNMLMNRNVAKVDGIYSRLYVEGYRGAHLVAGIDLGKESDSTVVTIVEAEWDSPALYEVVNRDYMDTEFTAYNKHVLAWMELQGDDYEYQYGEIVQFLRRFRGLQKVVLDATREASFHDRLSHQPGFEDVEFEDFIFSTATKAAGYRIFQGDILSGRFTFPAGVEARVSPTYRKFVTQMLDLTKTYSGEFLQVAAPDEKGAHDDYACSAMLACWGANTPAKSLQVQGFSGSMMA